MAENLIACKIKKLLFLLRLLSFCISPIRDLEYLHELG